MGQMRLLDFNWPRSVLRMPFCEAVKERTTRALLMRGPRVRMGIHAPPLGHGSPDWDDPACGVEMKVRCASSPPPHTHPHRLFGGYDTRWGLRATLQRAPPRR